jgi:hypothetical protein
MRTLLALVAAGIVLLGAREGFSERHQPPPAGTPVLRVTKVYERPDGSLCVEARAVDSPHQEFTRRCVDPDDLEGRYWARSQVLGQPVQD